MSRPPRISNWLPWEQSTIYFLTFCVQDRKSVLANAHAWKTCCAVFERLDQWTILAAIAMPDHLHSLIAPSDRDASVGEFAKWFKRWFREEYRKLSGSQDNPTWHWQEGCFDRLLRSDESLSQTWEYLRQNPVRAALVGDSDEWPYQFQFNEESQYIRPSL